MISASPSETLVQLFHTEPFHFNKVDVLTRRLLPVPRTSVKARLLVSLRELELWSVVARPSEQPILVGAVRVVLGASRRLFIDGAIEVFDNNPVIRSRPHPRLLRLDLDDHRAEELLRPVTLEDGDAP